MSTQWKREDVVRKVQALLRLAGNNPDEGEVQAAMGKVRELLKAHDLEMTDVQLQEEVNDLTTEYSEFLPRTYQWCWTLANATSKLTNTTYFRRQASDGIHRNLRCTIAFCGTKTDVCAAQSLFLFLYTTTISMGKEQKFEERQGYNSYRMGVADRVLRRVITFEEVEKQKSYKVPEGGQSYFPIVQMKKEAIEKYMKKEHDVKNVSLRTHLHDAEAYSIGYAHGARVPLAVNKALPQ